MNWDGYSTRFAARIAIKAGRIPDMKIMSVVGARPNFMKIAPFIAAIREHNKRAAGATFDPCLAADYTTIQHVLVHTGQHYDKLMSDSFFTDLNLPEPDIHLGVGSGSHAIQTSEVMRKFEEALLQEAPDVLVVVGDVNSTLACALVAAKISFNAPRTRPIIAHVEAGLRSFDRTMPEEINRILTDHLSDMLFVTEESALQNLASEGIPAEKVHFVGNAMIDSLLACKERAELSSILDNLGLRSSIKGGSAPSLPYALLTLHRPANVDVRDSLLNIIEGLQELAHEYSVIFPAHPRTQNRINEFGLQHYFEWNRVQPKAGQSRAATTSGRVRIIEPLAYLDFLCLMSSAQLVITDSGGIQEETTCLNVPCVTVRENTERPITITSGTNVLAGVTADGICATIRRQLKSRIKSAVPELWDGKAALRILDVVRSECQKRKSVRMEATWTMPVPTSIGANK
jgi:UDP-N-acetylglucosamine 2-epimerase (non-hydrolysing)